MSAYNKILWSEGLFLRPQHFQQQDRWVEQALKARVAALGPYWWGVSELEIDRDALANRDRALRVAFEILFAHDGDRLDGEDFQSREGKGCELDGDLDFHFASTRFKARTMRRHSLSVIET